MGFLVLSVNLYLIPIPEPFFNSLAWFEAYETLTLAARIKSQVLNSKYNYKNSRNNVPSVFKTLCMSQKSIGQLAISRKR